MGCWIGFRASARFVILPAVGGALIAGVLGATGCDTLNPPMRNPIAPTEASVNQGGAIYAERCAVCHGIAGRGDGPSALALNPKPADLRVHLAAGHSDAQLFDWVSNGYPDSAMPAFKTTLSADERWHVLNYIRSSFGSGTAPPS